MTVTLKKCENSMEDLNALSANDMHVLIVDDDPVASEHAMFVLEEAGISADVALSGREAIDMLGIHQAKQEPYNLVLLDWKMPEMDGLDIARKIRKRCKSDIMIVVLTAYNWDDIAEEAKEAGIDGFLAKPLASASVLEEITRIARRNSINLLTRKPRADLKGRHILLAEDIFINAEIVKELIHAKEAEIDHAENGRIVTEMFAKSEPGHYDAILMDVRMPEMDGLEATATIRAMDRPDASTIPIIAMTANAFDEDVQYSLQAGMNAHLSKPVEPEHLYQTLEEMIWEKDSKYQSK